MKTEKYTIQFVSIDTPLSTEISISKSEYNKQLKFLSNRIDETSYNEYPIEQYVTVNENDQIIITRNRFSVGTGDTWLTSYVCKQGYHFK